jgi:AcrR family transcriptional regulator
VTVSPGAKASSAGARRLAPATRQAQIIASAREVFLRHGFVGTRVRDIAEQAGISENLVYTRFNSKTEIYQAAVTDPLDALVDQIVDATQVIVTAPGSNRTQAFEMFHRVLLTSMLDSAPLLAVALFSHPATGRQYYSEVVLPRFTKAIATVIQDVTGWPLQSLDLDVIVEGLLGLHFGLALNSIFERRAPSVEHIAAQLAVMFGSGIVDMPGPLAERADRSAPVAPKTSEGSTTHARRRPAESRVRMHTTERRAAIIDAAAEVFVEEGLAGARTKDIARRAGITEAFMFRLFDSKEQLYHASVEERAEVLLSQLERGMDEIMTAQEGGIETLLAINECGVGVFRELAPVAVVGLFSDMQRGKEFYARSFAPPLRRIQQTAPRISGWNTAGVAAPVLWRALFGIQFGMVVHHMLTQKSLDVSDIAQRLTQLIATGLR